MVLKAYDLGHDVRATIASSYTLHNVSMGLNTRLRGFLRFYNTLLIPTRVMQKKRVEDSDGKLPRNVVQNWKMQLPTRRTVWLLLRCCCIAKILLLIAHIFPKKETAAVSLGDMSWGSSPLAPVFALPFSNLFKLQVLFHFRVHRGIISVLVVS